MKKFIAILLLWAVCGYIDYGYTLGDFTHRFPELRVDPVFLTFMTIGGPISFPAVFSKIEPGPHHWLTKPLTNEERWKVFHDRYPNLDRAEFELLTD